MKTPKAMKAIIRIWAIWIPRRTMKNLKSAAPRMACEVLVR
jgi:hypothetical protein